MNIPVNMKTPLNVTRKSTLTVKIQIHVECDQKKVSYFVYQNPSNWVRPENQVKFYWNVDHDCCFQI